ncbi:hypothetical protein CS0771_53730 [Catellatospora sp. IY07-71]|uniref:erythromycin esterase family protein n=1 Tax=Catellatospora sp. IY07-71 TaxID=2728827 RepID=UPI001BB3C433|nr:erythromycin esterase family protein [Catellatospora sp. IY07-71]BCJ75829.1 hypothetical protein CS0771_53730 [Catellatospora sp. IY07-71]
MLVQTLRTAADFTALLERIGDARLVLLGEASHGTHEFYRLREQLTRRLIAERGFSFVAVEGDWPDCNRVHRAVTGAPGGLDPITALHEFARWPTWMWANTEVAAFCRWLRAWNLNQLPAGRVGFYGLDVYSLWESMQVIVDYVRDHDPAGLDAVWDAYRCFQPYSREPQEYALACRFVSAGCEDEVARLLTQARAQMSLDGATRFDVWQNAQIVADAERYYRAMIGGGAHSWNVRDIHMADTLDRLLNHHGPAAKAVVWAHNTHVGDARATDMAAANMVNIGQLARHRHGRDAVVLVGFGCHRGQVMAAPGWAAPRRVMIMPPARAGSLEDLLHHRLPGPSLLIFPDTEGPPWLTEVLDHRAVGVVYHPGRERSGNYVPTRLGERYDAFVWCDQTTAVHPLHAQPAPGEMETYPSGV